MSDVEYLMQTTNAWNRILREGLDGGSLTGKEAVEKIRQRVVALPFIVDERSVERLYGTFDWTRFKNIAVPFEQFTVTCRSPDNCDIVMYAEAMPADSGSGRDIYLVMMNVWPGGQPVMFAIAVFKFDSDGDLVIREDGRFNAAVKIPPVIMRGSHAEINNFGRCVLTYVDAFLDTLLTLNRENVELRPKQNPPAESHIAAKKYGGKPGQYRHYTLTSRPAGHKSSDVRLMGIRHTWGDARTSHDQNHRESDERIDVSGIVEQATVHGDNSRKKAYELAQ